jgi:hypothetical protein
LQGANLEGVIISDNNGNDYLLNTKNL